MQVLLQKKNQLEGQQNQYFSRDGWFSDTINRRVPTYMSSCISPIVVAPHESWDLILELAHSQPILSIHSQWGLRTCFATASSYEFEDRQGENAMQLHLLLEAESLVYLT